MKIILYFALFLLGFFSCIALLSISYSPSIEIPLSFSKNSGVDSPADYLDEKDIMIYDNMVVLMVEDASISRYMDSGSMRPVIDSGANGIRIIPKDESEINVGDIVTFRQGSIFVVHRVVTKDVDENGVYFITSGDNNNYLDSKIRFSDIKYKTIGILY